MTEADQVNATDTVYFGKASACHLSCTTGTDDKQRSTFSKVKHQSRKELCSNCKQEGNLNTGSHSTVTIGSNIDYLDRDWKRITCTPINSSIDLCYSSNSIVVTEASAYKPTGRDTFNSASNLCLFWIPVLLMQLVSFIGTESQFSVSVAIHP